MAVFPRIIKLYPVLNKVARIEYAVVYARTHFFNIFKLLKSRNRKCASFSVLRNLITRLHLKFLPKLHNKVQKYQISWTAGSHCILKADSIRVAQTLLLFFTLKKGYTPETSVLKDTFDTSR